VCVCVYVCVCACVCVCVFMDICMHFCVCVCMCVCVCVYVCVCVLIDVCMHACMCVCMHACMQVQACERVPQVSQGEAFEVAEFRWERADVIMRHVEGQEAVQVAHLAGAAAPCAMAVMNRRAHGV